MISNNMRKMIDLDQVLALVPVGRTTLFRMERDKQFPASRFLRGRKVWFEDEVVAWQAALPVKRGRAVSRRAAS